MTSEIMFGVDASGYLIHLQLQKLFQSAQNSRWGQALPQLLIAPLERHVADYVDGCRNVLDPSQLAVCDRLATTRVQEWTQVVYDMPADAVTSVFTELYRHAYSWVERNADMVALITGYTSNSVLSWLSRLHEHVAARAVGNLGYMSVITLTLHKAIENQSEVAPMPSDAAVQDLLAPLRAYAALIGNDTVRHLLASYGVNITDSANVVDEAVMAIRSKIYSAVRDITAMVGIVACAVEDDVFQQSRQLVPRLHTDEDVYQYASTKYSTLGAWVPPPMYNGIKNGWPAVQVAHQIARLECHHRASPTSQLSLESIIETLRSFVGVGDRVADAAERLEEVMQDEKVTTHFDGLVDPDTIEVPKLTEEETITWVLMAAGRGGTVEPAVRDSVMQRVQDIAEIQAQYDAAVAAWDAAERKAAPTLWRRFTGLFRSDDADDKTEQAA